MNRRLTEEDLLKKEHLPAIVFLNAIKNNEFIDTIEQMSKEIGRGFNEVDCCFPGDLEQDDEAFEGVEFALGNQAIVLDYKTYFYYLKLTCLKYVSEFSQEQKLIKKYLKVIKEKYNL
ncbi:hypothetical protein NL50_09410 [Clostridium acetobutylicum]|nr:hypothetical protein NL50_09410 [Clostridium acetobutylicum]